MNTSNKNNQIDKKQLNCSSNNIIGLLKEKDDRKNFYMEMSK